MVGGTGYLLTALGIDSSSGRTDADLAVAIDAERRLDPEAVDAVVEMFLPQMPEIGRSAGIVGPEVPVPEGASAQDRLLGAMGRRP